MIKGFVAYDLAIRLYRDCEQIKAKHYLRDQLLRASLSIVLNIAEGSGKQTLADKRRFYSIALGSARETQALLTVLDQGHLLTLADRLGGLIYGLIYPKK